MIHVYGLTYRMTDYCRRSVESIVRNSSEPIHFTVVDSRSPKTTETVEWGRDALRSGLIQRFLSAEGNCKAQGLDWAFRNFPPDEDRVVFTDLDIMVPDGLDWVKLLRESPEVLVGWSLDLSNYCPPNQGHSNAGFGIWLLGLSAEWYKTHYQPGSIPVDSYLIATALPSVRHLPQKLIHLGWDIWRDDPEYWQQKMAGVNWWDVQTCNFKVIERA